MRLFNQFSPYIAGLAFLLLHSFASGDEQTGATSSGPAVEHGYLGVLVSSVHPALAANLKGLLKPEQGLTVEEVAKDSAAMKSGIKVHDVLTSYDDQMLFSTEQLAKLIQSDPPGKQITLGVLRDGSQTRLQATLSRLDSADFRVWTPSRQAIPYRFGHPDRIPRFRGQVTPAAEWESFDSLTLKNLGQNRFHAELQYLDKNGKLQKFSSDGTRDEIHKAINDAKEMKPAERAHLIRSLNITDSINPTLLPHIWFEPGVGWFFEQPAGPFH